MDCLVNTAVIKESSFAQGKKSSFGTGSLTVSIAKSQKAIVQAINCQGSVGAVRTYLWDGTLTQISYEQLNSGSIGAISATVSGDNVTFTLTTSVYKFILVTYVN